jgi:alginate O-acetyltransferase complex protein AlgI
MLFNSIPFLFYFLPVAFAGYLVLSRYPGRASMLLWLTALSLFFYAYWNPPFILLLLGSIGVNYMLGRVLMVTPSKAILTLGVAINLAAIAVFKYAGFAVMTVNALTGANLPDPSIVLPLAISFFTFQQIAYLVDVYQGKVRDTDFVHYALFVSFFPQLIAGPIVHHGEIIPQFREKRERWVHPADVVAGAAIFIVGLQKKVVIADGIAVYADTVFANAAGHPPGMIAAWTGALAYTFQIYFDFSGYTDMAIGLARMFGIRLPENFNSPYKAVNIIDFWRRWHMTLSRFLRDYLYIPLGGNRRGEVRRHANILITMLLGGLWHGAAWTFVIWGGLHGVALVINHLWHGLRRRLGHDLEHSTPFGNALSRTLTLLAVIFGWVLFRAESFADAGTIMAGMLGIHGFGAATPGTQTAFSWFVVLGLIVLFMPNTKELLEADLGRAGRMMAPRLSWMVPTVGVMGTIALMIVIAKAQTANQFIYMVF